MQDYVDKLLFAINNYDSSNIRSVNALRDLVCWISDNEELKKTKSLRNCYILPRKRCAYSDIMR